MIQKGKAMITITTSKHRKIHLNNPAMSFHPKLAMVIL